MTTAQARETVWAKYPEAKVTRRRRLRADVDAVYRIWTPDRDGAPDWPEAPTEARAWKAAAEAIGAQTKRPTR